MSLAQIGEKIRKLRIHAGLPQSQLARLYGLSRATISQLENGTLNDLGLTKLVAVMEILGIEMKVSHSPSLTSALSVAARRISPAIASLSLQTNLHGCCVPTWRQKNTSLT